MYTTHALIVLIPFTLRGDLFIEHFNRVTVVQNTIYLNGVNAHSPRLNSLPFTNRQ